MRASEHVETARKLLVDADREYEAGDALQASEKLWGAASHVVTAEMHRRGIARNGHRATINAVRQFGEDYEDGALLPLFKVAEMLHANFYHGFLHPDKIPENRDLVHDFVGRMLTYTNGS